MLASMKKIALLLLLVCLPAQAGFYKGYDEDGNVVYSDKPFANASKITPPSLSVVERTAVPDKDQKAGTPQADDGKSPQQTSNRYTRLSITSPKHQQTVWNQKSLSVSVGLKPKLNRQAGDYLQLLVDGKIVLRKATSTTLDAGYIPRGEHRLQVALRNKKGKLLRRSRAITVHIKHSVQPKKAPRGG